MGLWPGSQCQTGFPASCPILAKNREWVWAAQLDDPLVTTCQLPSSLFWPLCLHPEAHRATRQETHAASVTCLACFRDMVGQAVLSLVDPGNLMHSSISTAEFLSCGLCPPTSPCSRESTWPRNYWRKCKGVKPMNHGWVITQASRLQQPMYIMHWNYKQVLVVIIPVIRKCQKEFCPQLFSWLSFWGM